jgi:heme exporter protein A
MPDTAPPPTTVLRFADIVRGFGRLPVLRGVSGEVRGGELMLVTGHNGSGKSTLLRCLAGLLAPDAGTIEQVEDGRSLEDWERRLHIGYLAPDLAFYEEMTVFENLRFFARMRRVPEARITELLERVNLTPKRAAGALSSGMLQRLRWAWALLHRPRVLLLDEPLQNLDEPGRETSRALIAEHLEQGGVAVVANPRDLELPHHEPKRLDLGG